MRLNSIKLSGFKSFADMTQFSLPGQLVGVVGPNGCGKSNIIDAVRWVLGESKASELRGESMQDVIFSGAGSRKPAGRASVELVFANEDARAGGPWNRFVEIAVKRVLTRDGTSSYFINNQPVRRRDVQDVFLGTGLGPRAYAIIGQGTISRIIESRPEELRLFLEEAAGVSKYKERRRETESRLKETRENLLRVDDILRELNGNLAKLEQQAEVAGRYRTLQQSGTRKLQQLWFLKQRDAAREEQRVRQAVNAAVNALEARSAELRHGEAALDRIRQSHYAAGDALHAAQGALAEAALEVSRLEERIRYMVEGRKRAEARLAESQVQRESWGRRQGDAQAELAHVDAQTEAADAHSRLLAAQAAEQADQLPAAEDALRAAQAAAGRQRSAVTAVQQQIQVLAADRRSIDEQRRQQEGRRDRLAAERQQLAVPDPDRLAALRRRDADAGQAQAVADARLAELAEQVPGLDDARRARQQQAGAEAARQTELAARAQALSALQDRVQTEGKLKPWLARHGLDGLAGLWTKLHVEPGWETALEAALRERIGALEVGRIDSLRAFAADAPPARLAFYTAPDAAAGPVPVARAADPVAGLVPAAAVGAAGADRAAAPDFPALHTDQAIAPASTAGVYSVAIADVASTAAAAAADASGPAPTAHAVRAAAHAVRAADATALRLSARAPGGGAGELARLPTLVQRLRPGAVEHAALRPLLADWLDGVHTAASLDDALAARHELAHGQVVMTREGHAVSAFAVAFYAPDSEQAGLLARAQEIDNLDRQLRAQALIADESRGASVRAEAAYSAAAAQLAAARRDAVEAQTRAHQAQVELLRLTQQAQQADARRGQLTDELADIDARADELAERAATGEARFDELDVQLGVEQERHAAFDDAVIGAERLLAERRDQLRTLEREAQEAQFGARALAARRAELQRTLATAQQQLAAHDQSLAQLTAELRQLADSAADSGLQVALAVRVEREAVLAASRAAYDELSAALRRADEQRMAHEHSLQPMRERITQLQLEVQAAQLGGAQFSEQLDAAGLDADALAALAAEVEAGDVRLHGLQGEIDRINREVGALGAVNLAALDELGATRERKTFLDAQLADLNEAIATLDGAIHKIDLETRDLLGSTFEQVNGHFGRMFPTLFGGGTAKLVMTGDEILDAGVQVMAQPPGKRNSTIHLLSGGEKALTAIALVFAIFQLNPAPFCLLDEVDAPLDDANTERYAKLVRQMAEGTQFLFISHNRIAMEMAQQLIGVTMQEQGVSRIVAVDVQAAVGFAEEAGRSTAPRDPAAAAAPTAAAGTGAAAAAVI